MCLFSLIHIFTLQSITLDPTFRLVFKQKTAMVTVEVAGEPFN
ncbi:hypothetical protein N478_11355 [Pseudoalteromonas luteoviolacea S4060-1]|uniref:Uncharacterized protein n=1 Tax=Pseudoalteromonas luteoviolacea S4060-1 TaxID=1365257 RepID=A0A167P055_9GAMM|nr:hypothetical protein N478_11355 [Pseudoalteromonas luteoviolacea S4060-1]